MENNIKLESGDPNWLVYIISSIRKIPRLRSKREERKIKSIRWKVASYYPIISVFESSEGHITVWISRSRINSKFSSEISLYISAWSHFYIITTYQKKNQGFCIFMEKFVLLWGFSCSTNKLYLEELFSNSLPWPIYHRDEAVWPSLFQQARASPVNFSETYFFPNSFSLLRNQSWASFSRFSCL